MSLVTIGLIGQPKKFTQFFDGFIEHCATAHPNDVRCIPLRFHYDASTSTSTIVPLRDPSVSAQETHFDVLFHKLSDELAVPDDAEAKSRIEAVQGLVACASPNCFLFEELRLVAQLMDRFDVMQMLADCAALTERGIAVPRTRAFDDDRNGGCPPASVGTECATSVDGSEPLYVWKTRTSCGQKHTHFMTITAGHPTDQVAAAVRTRLPDDVSGVLCQDFIADVEPFVLKVYVIGPSHVSIRVISMGPLIADAANVARTGAPISFDSQNKAIFHALPDSSVAALKASLNFDVDIVPWIESIAKILRNDILGGMSLFGFDVLMQTAARRTMGRGPRGYIVDINHFPGF